jgi:hypothetical protein
VSYAFVFRAYPDVDHMVPLAWRLVEDGEEVHAVVSPGYDAAKDHHLRYVSRYPNLHVTELGGGRVATHLRGTLPYALLFMLRKRVKVVHVEWGYGLPEGYEKLLSPRGIKAVARSLVRSLLHGGDPQQVRTSFIVAARLLGRSTVCLPHGLNVKLDAIISSEVLASGANGYDWRDRNRFSAYVLNTADQLDWHLDNAKGDPSVMHAWGSLRWAPEWVEVNRRLAPPFEWPERAGGRVKVTFMVPKWKNRVDKDAAVSLVKMLQARDDVSLAIKGHPRPEDGAADPLHADPEVDWTRIHDVSKVDSVPLIGASDIVIDVGSSIGIEVLMQGKVLLNPTYVHELTTMFDDIPGCCVVANSEDEVAAYVDRHAAGKRHEVPADTYDRLMRRAVFADRDEPFDVLGLYSERVRALAGARS